MARFIGVTCHQNPQVLKQALERHELDSTQMALNIAQIGNAAPSDKAGKGMTGASGFEAIAMPVALRKKMGLTAMKVFAQEKLLGKAAPEMLLRYSMTLPVSAAVVGMPQLDHIDFNHRGRQGVQAAEQGRDEVAAGWSVGADARIHRPLLRRSCGLLIRRTATILRNGGSRVPAGLGRDYFPGPGVSIRHAGARIWDHGWGAATKYLRDADDYWFHVYQPQPGDVIVDIGAGRGEDVFAFSKAVGRTGHVWAIEAHPTSYTMLGRFCRAERPGQCAPREHGVDAQAMLHIETLPVWESNFVRGGEAIAHQPRSGRQTIRRYAASRASATSTS